MRSAERLLPSKYTSTSAVAYPNSPGLPEAGRFVNETVVVDVLLVLRKPFIRRLLPGVSTMPVLNVASDDHWTLIKEANPSEVGTICEPVAPAALLQFV